ncbi:hypothetical protein CEXT_774571 [Caerostris extrusa]|uniref:Uncharacterized protein n=1 Tax=Caerostris extrusa TaxID=172846 RepID=A0AAV4UBT3_CAEEX|nr:hypothetical protein CEXT_774571 [Caerostris extrusa]
MKQRHASTPDRHPCCVQRERHFCDAYLEEGGMRPRGQRSWCSVVYRQAEPAARTQEVAARDLELLRGGFRSDDPQTPVTRDFLTRN